MTIRYNITFRPTRQPDPPGDLPIRLNAPGPRVIPARHRTRRPDWALAGSALLHAAVLALFLLIVRTVVPAPPPEAPTVALAFEQAAAPAPASEAPPAPAQPPPPQAAPPPPQPQPPPEPKPPPPPEPQPPPLPVQQPPPPAPQPPPPTPQPPPPDVVAEPLPLPPPPPPRSPPRPRPPPARAQTEERPLSPPQPAAPSPAPEAAAPASAPAPAEAPSPQFSESWRQALAAWLAAHKVYPEEAVRRDEQGNVTLRFTVEPSGRVENVTVVHGSGSPRLDAAAQAMLRGATLPPFDPSMPQVPITTTVPIHYELQD